MGFLAAIKSGNGAGAMPGDDDCTETQDAANVVASGTVARITRRAYPATAPPPPTQATRPTTNQSGPRKPAPNSFQHSRAARPSRSTPQSVNGLTRDERLELKWLVNGIALLGQYDADEREYCLQKIREASPDGQRELLGSYRDLMQSMRRSEFCFTVEPGTKKITPISVDDYVDRCLGLKPSEAFTIHWRRRTI